MQERNKRGCFCKKRVGVEAISARMVERLVSWQRNLAFASPSHLSLFALHPLVAVNLQAPGNERRGRMAFPVMRPALCALATETSEAELKGGQ